MISKVRIVRDLKGMHMRKGYIAKKNDNIQKFNRENNNIILNNKM